jgi:DNA-binding NarL/FixJ family response regulator
MQTLRRSGARRDLIKKPKDLTLDARTDKEQIVLSAIGDGFDDPDAAERLGLSRLTIMTHRTAIMKKLGFYHKGQLLLYALQQG